MGAGTLRDVACAVGECTLTYKTLLTLLDRELTATLSNPALSKEEQHQRLVVIERLTLAFGDAIAAGAS